MKKPEVVTLCGSTKFKDEFMRMNRILSMQGKIVLSVAFYTHADNEELTEEQKENLDNLHFRKIDISDSVFVIDVNGYIGQSTNNEIEYAKVNGKRIEYYSEWIKKNG